MGFMGPRIILEFHGEQQERVTFPGKTAHGYQSL